MYYYLNGVEYKVLFVIYSILAGAFIIPTIVLLCDKWNLGMFIFLILCVFIYLLFAIFFYRRYKKCLKEKNTYLLLSDERLEAVYKENANDVSKLELSYEQLVRMEYFRIISIASFFYSIISMDVPTSIYITYEDNDAEIKTRCVGYLSYKDFKQIKKTITSKTTRVKIKVY